MFARRDSNRSICGRALVTTSSTSVLLYTHRSIPESEDLAVKCGCLSPDDGDIGGVEVVEEEGECGGVWRGGGRVRGGSWDVDTGSEPTRRPC